MKKIISIFALTGVLLSVELNVFGQQNEKAAQAIKNVKKDQKDRAEAKKDSSVDFRKFKLESNLKITENKKKIQELKNRKLSEDKEAKDKYDKKILVLEQKNNALRSKITAADTVKVTMWTVFKAEVKHDMDEFADAFKNIGVN